jgi:6-phosphogluconolactonase
MRRLFLLSLGALLCACPSKTNPGPQGGSGGAGGRGGSGGSGGGRGDAGSGGASGSGGSGGALADGRPTDRGATPDTAGTGTTYVFTSSSTGYGAAATLTAFKLDLASGALTKGPTATGRNNVFYGAFSPDKKVLLTVTEEDPAHLSSFSINAATGALTPINDVTTGAANAEHVAFHPGGQWAAVAHYTGGQVTLHPVMAGGTVMAPADTKQAATGAGSNCHQAVFDSTGGFLFVPCLGPQHVAQFRLMNGTLMANTPATVGVTGAPRHLAFGSGEAHAYAVTEAQATLVTFGYDKAAGKLTAAGSPAPAFVTEAGGGSHVIVHPGGKFLFAGSRFDNAIVTFAIDASSGVASKSSSTDDSLSYPRDFAIDASGSYLIAGTQPNTMATMPANRKPSGGGKLVVFKIDPTDGKLTRVGTPVDLQAGTGSVWWVGALAVP